MKYNVFISYSRSDYADENKQVIPHNIVSKIKDLFDANNISYWFDEDGDYSGADFSPIITRSIKDSTIFLFISSENSNKSEWTSREIAVANLYKKRIIPFRYDDSVFNESIILRIANLDYIDYYANEKKGLSRLLSSIQNYLQEDIEKQEKERQEEECRRQAEISQQEKNAKICELRTEVSELESRKLVVEQEIQTKETALTNLKNEKCVIETTIAELNSQLDILADIHVGNNKFDNEEDRLNASEWILMILICIPSAGLSVTIAIIFAIINLSCRLKGKTYSIKPKFVKYFFIGSVISFILYFTLCILINLI